MRSKVSDSLRCCAIQGVVANATTVIGKTAMAYSKPTRGAKSASSRRSDGSASLPVTKR